MPTIVRVFAIGNSNTVGHRIRTVWPVVPLDTVYRHRIVLEYARREDAIERGTMRPLASARMK